MKFMNKNKIVLISTLLVSFHLALGSDLFVAQLMEITRTTDNTVTMVHSGLTGRALTPN